MGGAATEGRVLSPADCHTLMKREGVGIFSVQRICVRWTYCRRYVKAGVDSLQDRRTPQITSIRGCSYRIL